MRYPGVIYPITKAIGQKFTVSSTVGRMAKPVTQKFCKRIDKALKSGFQLSVESNYRLLWVCFTSLSDWLEKGYTIFPPIRSKINLAPNTCNWFEL